MAQCHAILQNMTVSRTYLADAVNVILHPAVAAVVDWWQQQLRDLMSDIGLWGREESTSSPS